jgi:glycosyltransferase involved in cell wall biosynthesis
VTVRVLGLTTTAWRSFYEQQEAAVRGAGVDYTTLEVPGDHRGFDDAVRRRSPLDYLRFYPRVLAHSVGDYDLVHANYGLTVPIAIAQPRLPVVATLWGGEFVGNRFAPLIRAGVKRVAAVVVPSEPMLDRLPPSVRDRTHLVPFPVDTDLFRPRSRAAAREAVGWDTDRRVVLFPYAEARYEKNYPLAERVVDGLDADVELRSVANEPYESMPDYLNASDALLITSRWESGPMTVKEALACDLPVVSRPVGFAPVVLDGVRNCRVGATERELRRGLADALAAGRAVGGRDRVVSYGREEMGERLRAVYDRCLDEQ